ncbi:Alanine--tRNA ligase [Candidatus Methanobinarius endosymbioticus]|uniref:Alanine--tRNA ligase n=1 Tax=Candidatus Methanobinarius endosymbioticus TaxID=2006182 RepID=A0A366MB09_9EURY|nr:Alanine--tRNA ligase [Candidatus Methanobinarius endosymbioticus]
MTEILKELGYTRQKCEKCENHFWSIPERATCGDAPCDEYEFIGNPATDKNYDLFEIQKAFTEFFENNGHTPIPRYPVLAKRWRDDVFLVGASIYDFQPWITCGLVEPPANPLVIAQPAIRLNDVDNVGRTGRHMTCFTMGAHHAFNRPDNEIYWKDETVRLCHGFIDSIGIDPAEITFIESWWEGGGNAGPCYEVCVRGVELATLVFMQYKILPNGDKEEIPLKTVDTGYGLERFAWISQGTPTAYDACFSPVINKLKEMTNINVDEKILAENAQIAGMMDIETFADIRSLREKVADKLNISIEELLKSTEPMEAIYAIADHTRCLAFMSADGIIPSNVKEGYLARLVLRRTIRFMKELNMDESLYEIMEIQLDFLSKFYPEIKDTQEHIMNIINLEEERYAKTIDKGNRIVKRTIKHLKKQNKNLLPVETLIDLYDAHGMPPETVKEIAEQNYKEDEFVVNIPDNFFTLVANQHSEEKIFEEDKLEVDYPPTDLLFYDDFYTSEFNAEVLDVIEIRNSKNKTNSKNNKNKEKNENKDFIENKDLAIILDQTAFYPEGGGQPSDLGYLNIENDEIEVIHAQKINTVVLHKIKTDKSIDYFKNNEIVGKSITGKIDWNRRISLARNHTATHLILASAKKVLGDHIWQAGAQKGLERSRLDLSHYKRISQEEINRIEKIANELVMENICVDITWMSRDEAEKAYGFTLYQGGTVPGSTIRVINIPDIDVQACAGTHVLNTGNIGLLKINKTERIQDGVERIDFSAGSSAINSMQINDEYLRESGNIFKVTSDQLPKTCERFFTEWKSYKNEINKLKSEIANLKINDLDNSLDEINGLKVIKQIIDGDIKELQKIATDFTDNKKTDIAILANNEGKIVGAASKLAIDKNIKINDIIKESAQILGGGGGGRPTFAQGAGQKTDKIEEAVDLAIDLIKNS